MSRDPIDLVLALPFWLLLLVLGHPAIVIAAVFLLFYWGRRGGRRQGLARILLLLVAIASTGLAVFFLYSGFAMRWSSDGPGLLVVFIGIGGFGVLAIVTWVLWALRMIRS